MEKVIEVHTEEFGSQPEIVVTAPSKFDIIGEHSSFFNDKTLSMAIDLPVYVALSKRTDNLLRFFYYQQKERKKIPLSITKHRKEDKLANIVKAVIAGYAIEGYSFSGFDVTFFSEISPSVEFGITSALKSATAFAIKKLFKIRGNDSFLLRVIENGDKQLFNSEFYSSDINTSLFAKKNSCIVTDSSDNSYQIVPFKFEGMSIILTDTKVPRATMWSETSLYSEENKELMLSLKRKRNSQTIYEDSISEINDVLCNLSEEVRRRLMCIMKENQNLIDAVDALKNSNLHNFAKIVNKSHELMRDLFMISCPEIDWLVKRVQEFDQNSLPVLFSCSRITGRGFARCTYSIIKDEYVDSYMQKLQDFERIFGFHPTTYIVRPSAGASIIKELDK
ncbi:MAG: galactokinase [Spirochaetaceae bacterium]|nr:galactokinase [Spirochaetaceae bacterium]